MDTKGGLSAQVRGVESGAVPEVQGNNEPYACAISGDGKAMAVGNPPPRRHCWSCMLSFHEFQGRLKVVDTVDDVARPGAFIGCIHPGNRVSDRNHGGGRITNVILKRAKECVSAHVVRASFVQDIDAYLLT